jgi:hypothetical protein
MSMAEINYLFVEALNGRLVTEREFEGTWRNGLCVLELLIPAFRRRSSERNKYICQENIFGLKSIPGPLETKCKFNHLIAMLCMGSVFTHNALCIILVRCIWGENWLLYRFVKKNLTINKSDDKFRVRAHRIASYFCNIDELITTSQCNFVNAFGLRCCYLQLLGLTCL